MALTKAGRGLRFLSSGLALGALAFASLLGTGTHVASATTIGHLKVCKAQLSNGLTGTFTFTITGPNGYNQTFNVPVGDCTPMQTLPAGNYTVTEQKQSNFPLHYIAVQPPFTANSGPSKELVSEDLSNYSVTVVVSDSQVLADYPQDFANGRPPHTNVVFTDQLGCTYTQGFYKNHPSALPAGGLTIGGYTYTPNQLVNILQTPPAGNGAYILIHQLIAAEANAAGGAPVPSSVQTAIQQANSLLATVINSSTGAIGYLSPSQVSALTDTLDQYNSGVAAGGPSDCS